MTLITGATGFIGSHLIDRLKFLKQPFRCLLRRGSLRPMPEGVETVEADLSTGQGLDRALDGVACVIHLAGVTKTWRLADYYTGNAGATAILCKALAGKGIRLVHVSSLAAMGPNASATPLREDAAPAPFTHYGKSKLEAEKTVRAEVPDAVIVRPPVVYGPRDTDVFKMLEAVSRGWMLEIGGGERYFSAIFVRDLVEGLLVAAAHPAASGRTYFLAHPEPLTWTRLGNTAARILGKRARTVRVPVPIAWLIGLGAEAFSWISRKPVIISREKVAEAQCRNWTCDPQRAADELGFVASTSLDRGLAETLAWYKEAGWLTN
ncbi:MAG TPA: NAD-dependent epimerase/dehydratase family protein [Verrucomicrobiae bacterium]|nr:NAD-dependent epimerase/dehydratase family protein [Verrucomicrobiae bacterium]